VGGSVFFRDGTRVTGAIDLRAKVSGQVNFSQATVNAGESGQAVDLDAAEVGGACSFAMVLFSGAVSPRCSQESGSGSSRRRLVRRCRRRILATG
ncbi:hypothetical protein, partial [Botrimarina hoheduenensis]